MICLALDTSGAACAVALYDTQRKTVIAERSDEIGRGHAEYLLPIIDQCLADAECELSELGRLAAVRGPGSFTGLRVGLATARGLGLALGIPVVGVSNLDVFENIARENNPEADIITVMDARRDQFYVQRSNEPGPTHNSTSWLMDKNELVALLAGFSGTICGSGVPLIADAIENMVEVHSGHSLEVAPIAKVAEFSAKLDPELNLPSALYLRKPDAKPQTAFTAATQI